ncbi:hypothetical protein U1763_00170 [Sphingomonas sp. LB2R24]|uniref:hypothetical protein n=1 Tax=Sphingomonas sorbitolis TaxID=3096165 RepID=UPI002FC6094C
MVQPGGTDDPGTRRDVGAGCKRPLGAPQIKRETGTIAGPAEHRYRLAISLIAARLQTKLLEPSIKERERYRFTGLRRSTAMEIIGAERADIGLDPSGGQNRWCRIGRRGEEEDEGKQAFHYNRMTANRH